MKEQTNNTVPPGPLARLVRCLLALGWDLGWRYWRLQNACFVDPSLALRIAEDAEQMAKQYRAQAENAKTEEWWTMATNTAECHESWAALVRKCHAEYSANEIGEPLRCASTESTNPASTQSDQPACSPISLNSTDQITINRNLHAIHRTQ